MRSTAVLLSCALLQLVCAAPASAQTDVAAELATAVREHSWELEVAADGLAATGGDWLTSRASDARFTLVGESHHNAETPALTTALLEALRPAGYAAYVVETGPVTTDLLVGRLREGGRDSATDLVSEYPFTLAFLDRLEELDTAQHALELGYEIWGVDQEFLGSARFLLSRLSELATDDASRELADSLLARAQEGFQRFVASGDQSAAFLLRATAEDFDRLASSFADEGDPAGEIVAQLRATWRIYGHFGAGRYYRNNAERIAWIKRNFLEHVQHDWGSPMGAQKALFKLGAAHAGRGRSPFYQHDLGNLAQELAAISRSESFHLTVMATSSVDAEGQVRQWDEPYLQPFFEVVEDVPRVFGLQALRPLLTQSRDLPRELEETRELALRYDALVVFPRFHPSEAVVPLPPR